MAHEDIPGLNLQRFYARSDGNYSRVAATWKTSAFTVQDTLSIMRLYPGMTVVSVAMHVTDLHASSNIDVGYAEADGSGGDGDYFFDGQVISALGYFNHREDGTGAKPFVVGDDDEYYLTLHLKGATIAASTEVEFEVFYTYEGSL